MPKQQKRRVRSNCWYFYSKTVDGGICNICKREVRSTGNTTNLLNHLKRRHTVQYNEVLANPEKYTVSLDEDSHSLSIDSRRVRTSLNCFDSLNNFPNSISNLIQVNINRRSFPETHSEMPVRGSTLEQFVNLLFQDHEGESSEHKHDQVDDAAKESEEANQSHSMEAFHADQGGTVIWLQPTADQQANTFQPQITIVQHSVQENSESPQAEGETILGTGEIVSSNTLPTIEDGSATSEAHKPSADNHHTQTHRKALMQNSPGKISRSSSRPQARSFGNLNPLKVVKQNTEMSDHLNREDTYDAFGRYVASLLRNLSSKKSACKLQKDIIWLVLQEQMRNEDS